MSASTVSGTIQDPSGQIFANGTWQLVFKPTPNTPGTFTDGGVPFTRLFGGSLDATGSFSQAGVARNDTIAPAGSKWSLIVAPNASSQAFSIDLNVNNAVFNASALINAVINNITVPATSIALAYKDTELIPAPKDGSIYFDNILNVLKIYDAVNGVWLTVGPTSTSPTFASLTVTPGLSSVQALTAAGNVTEIAGQNQYSAFKINNMLFVDGIKYTTIQAALNDLPSGGGIVFICPNDATGRYLETLTANLVISKSNTVIQFLCPALISTGAFRVTIASGLSNISILTPYAHSSNQGGSNLGVSFVPTSATPVFDLGDSSGFLYNIYLKGINVGLGGGGTASARAFRFTNVVQWMFENCQAVLDVGANQIGFETIGTGALFCGIGKIADFEIEGGASANSCKGILIGPISNDIKIDGGHATLPSGLSTIAIDVAGPNSSGIKCTGFDADSCNTALTVESTALGAFNGDMRIDSGTNNICNLGAGTNGNRLEIINGRALTTVVDNGTPATNSVYNSFDWQINSRRWRLITEAGGSGCQIVDQSDNSQMIAKGVGGATHCDSSAGNPFRTNQNTGAGVEFWNAGASVLTIDPTGTLHPGVAAAVGLGTTALPFLNMFLGTAATNNFKLQPAATAGARIITVTDPVSPTTVGLPLTIASGTAALTANAALAAVTSQAAITVAGTGILATDCIEWSYASAPGAGDSLCHVSPYVTAGNVNFVRTNPTAAAQNVSAIVINWRVIR